MVFLASEGGNAPEKLWGRKLFIVARDDGNEAGPRLPRISRQFDRTPEPKKLVVLQGSAHAQFLFDTDEGPELMRDILDFITAK
jgi:hypothetical protein